MRNEWISTCTSVCTITSSKQHSLSSIMLAILKTLTLPFKGKSRRIEVAYLKNRVVHNLKLCVIWTIERKGLDITVHTNLSFYKNTLKSHVIRCQ